MIIDRRAVHRLSQVAEERVSHVNPTADVAIILADGDLEHGRNLRPMKIERLIAAGGILTLEEQARVRYHQLGDLAAVAKELGRSVEWVREACAWDMAQEQKIA